MINGTTVTLTNGATDYNLLSLILKTLGYSPSDLTKIPDVQVSIDGTLPFFQNPVRELQIIGDSGNAGIITVKSKNGTLFPLAKTASDLIRSGCNDIDLSMFKVNAASAGDKLNIVVDAL